MVFLCRLDSTIAAALVPENKRASAIAFMFTGLTVATITGVPIGTFIGQQFGWRASFMVIVVIGIVALVANSMLIPSNLKKRYVCIISRSIQTHHEWEIITCFHHYCIRVWWNVCNVYVFITAITRSNRI